MAQEATPTPLSSAPDEAARRRGDLLRELRLLDGTADAELDDLVTLATIICGKPMGAITLLDETTLITKAWAGLSGAATVPVGDSLCQFTIQGTELMMVEDLNPRTASQPSPILKTSQVWLDAGIRFYAGMPLISEGGTAIGALCVMDSSPSTLTSEQQVVMAILSRQVSRLLQTRKHAIAMERMAEERDREQKMFHLVLDHVPVSIYLKDKDRRMRFYNQALADRFKIDRKAWIGKSNHDLWSHELADRLKLIEDDVLKNGTAHISLVDVPEHDGTVSHWKTNETRCINADGEPMLAGSAIDLTEQMQRESELERTRDQLKDANQKLSSLALTDALTGLWNRRAFDSRMETSVLTAHRHRRALTLLLVDVDHFKTVNDRFGHLYGDSVLKEIAAILNRSKRAEDVACRFGGEEFAVLLPDTDLQAGRHLAERLVKATREHSWDKTPVTISIGLSMCTPECISDDLIDEADAALYRAKRGGRDRVVLHIDPE